VGSCVPGSSALKNYKEVYGHLEKYECTRITGVGLDPSLSRVILCPPGVTCKERGNGLLGAKEDSW
jgi:hypothetical protein